MKRTATKLKSIANGEGLSLVQRAIAALTRAGATVIWPERAMGFGNPNLLSASEDFSSASWTKVSATAVPVADIGPGGASVCKLVEAASSGIPRLERNTSGTAGLTYTHSAVVKAGERTWVRVFEDSAASGAFFNLLAGQVGTVVAGTSASIVNLGNGYYYCSISAVQVGTTNRFRVAATTGDNVTTYTGDGASGIFVAGAKLEQGSTATAYTTQSQLRDFGIYQDSAGVTPTTALADLIGLMLDRTPNENGVAVARYGTPVVGLSSAWQSLGAGHSLTGGVMTLTSAAASTYSLKGLGLTAGKTYRFGVSVPALSGGTLQLLVGGGGSYILPSAGNYSFVLKPSAVDGPYLTVASGTVTAQITRLDWVEVRGNHATQATASSKPSIGRVPKRLGAELFGAASWLNNTAPTFDTLTGSTFSNATDKVSVGYDNALISVVSGVTYQITVPFTVASGSVVFSLRSGGALGTARAASANYTTSGTWSTTYTATATESLTLRVSSNTGSGATSVTVTSRSAKEVLEWSPAMIFDPAAPGDFLQTGITTGNTGWVCAGVTPAQVTTAATVINAGASGTTTKGVWLYAEAGKWLGQIGNGTARQEAARIDARANSPAVVSIGWDASTALLGVDAVENIAARSGDCTAPYPLVIGAYVGGAYSINGQMTCIAICPTLPPAADRALIRKFIGWLQAQTL